MQPSAAGAARRGAPYRRRTHIGRLVLGGVLLGLAIAAAAGLVIWTARVRALAESGRELRNMSFVLADHTDRALQAIDLALGAIQERARADGALAGADSFAGWAGTEARYTELLATGGALPQVDALFLVDGAGRVLASTRYWPVPPVDLSDRAFLRALRDGPDVTVLGPPVRNHSSGSWVIHVARRITGQDGAFLGVAAGAVALGYFEALYGSLLLGPDSSVALFRDSGQLVARFPPVDGAIGRDYGASEAFRVALDSVGGAPVSFRSGVDDRQRLISARALSSYPLRVHVGVAVDAALAGWREVTYRIAAGTVALLAMIGLAVLAASRTIRAEAKAAAERLQMERDAAEERLRYQSELTARQDDFRHVVEGMSQGVCKFGADGRMLLANDRCAALIGRPVEWVRPGVTLGELAASGVAGARDLVARLVLLAAGEGTDSFVHDLPDGRALSVLHQPLSSGGWLATFEDVTSRRAAEAEAQYLARHDALTGLPNRAWFHETLATVQAMAAPGGPHAPQGRRLAVLYMDLDRFKQVNDTLGHAVGDALLRAAAARISDGVRTRHGGRGDDIVARLGGDEFAVALRLPGGAAEAARADAAATASRLVGALSEPFMLDGQQVLVGATVGVALYPEDGGTAEELLRHADLALYRAKAEGRGRHRFFERTMDAEAQKRRMLELDLRRALIEDEGRSFELHFQPVVDTATAAPVGCEALVRWWRPGCAGLVGPGEFVPLAEETGLVVPLGDLVLRRACIEAASWPDRRLRIAVNLSPAQFRSGRLVETVSAALSVSGLDPRRLELEITEGVLLRGTEDALATMRRLRALGVRFAMDDFGTGYSSLAYLRSFPFDRVKVDRSFVREIESRPEDVAIVRAVAGMCRELGMTTVAEGVETAGQLRILAEARCTEAQGYLFSRAIHPDDLPDALRRLEAAAQPQVALAG